ncbi:MAG TPA: hypothetical protein VIV40_11130 [Kofleriaceae bacterium]
MTTVDAGARHWNGATWVEVANPASAAGCVPHDLWAAASDDVWVALGCRATGNNDYSLRRMMRWDGMSWSLVESLGSEFSPSGAYGFNAVWGSAPNNVYAVADTALFNFNGTSWSEVTGGPPGGGAVFGLAANDYYVIHQSTLWHWNGAQWSSRTPANSIAYGLQTAADSVWLGGNSNGAFFDGMFSVSAAFVWQPVGVANDVFVQEQVGLDVEEARYQGGFGGTRTATPAFFRQYDAWRSPSGNTYVVTGPSGGLVVHGP